MLVGFTSEEVGSDHMHYSGMQLAMLSDDVKERLGQTRALVAAPQVILCKLSSFQSKIARIHYLTVVLGNTCISQAN